MTYADWSAAGAVLTGTTYHHTSTARGYVSRKVACEIVPYNGKFGRGYAVYTPRWDSSRYCNVAYYVF